ncbi:MAG: insulinase family protein [Saprospiraceae bacterium]|nr:insulinase family protein [Saprospiraceae bacterium]
MRIVLSIIFLLIGFQFIFAQSVPIDPDIRYGKLSNGMAYYIRHNKEPKERASFYIIQDVGAILEEDDQDGLAHFLEHMAFNGTKHFPGKGIIKTLERHGVAFGRNINAYTSNDETVYNLSEVPIKNPGLLDTCLLILNDWSEYLLLTNEEIDAERGVISEEWRTRRNAGFRLREKYFPVLLKDSKFAQRDIIGKLDVIKNFKPETLKQFYKDWYRTDLQAIAIVGDIDVNEVEKKVKDLLGKIPAEPSPKERKRYDIPYHKESLYTKATDPEATSNSLNIYIKHKGTDPKNKDLKYYRELFVNQIFNRMMGDRINELLQKGEPPFITGSIGYGGFIGDNDVFSIGISAHSKKMDSGLKAIYTEALRVYQHGFTEGELERTKKTILTQTESQWKQKDKIPNDQYCRAIVQHYLDNSPLESIDQEWDLTQKILPTITLDYISSKIQQWLKPENRVVVITGPDSEAEQLLTEEKVLSILAEVEKSKIDPYEDKAVATSLINKDLKGSKIVKTKDLPQFNAKEWTLANNAKVIYRKADFQKDNISILAKSNGGFSLYGPPALPSAMLMSQFIPQFGVGDFDAVALKKMLSGKKASINSLVTELGEILSGSSTPKDVETMMQLLYLQFEHPRFDADAYSALVKRFEPFIENMNKNPQKIMSDSLSLIMSNYSDRTFVMDKSTIQKANVAEMERIYRDRFKDAGDFTFFIVGNIEENDVKPLVEKYIGSLTDQPRKERWKNNKVAMPKGKTEKEIKIPLQTEKANVVVAYSAASKYTPQNNLYMDIIESVLNLRFTEEIREKEGGTYGVSVRSSASAQPEAKKSLQMNFDTDPTKAEHLRSIVYREINKLASTGPTKEELEKAVKNLQKEREEAKPNNSYWMNTLVEFYENKIDNNSSKNYEDILKSATVNSVRDFAKAFFAKPDIVDVIFKPLK